MEVKYSYSLTQLESAVKFIARNNKSFARQNSYIKNHIISMMNKIIPDYGTTYLSTMGFTLLAEREVENIDNNYYSCHINILVDPSLGKDIDDDDLIDDTINTSIIGLDE